MAQVAVTHSPQLPHPDSTQSTLKDEVWQLQLQMGAGFIPASTTAQETGQCEQD